MIIYYQCGRTGDNHTFVLSLLLQPSRLSDRPECRRRSCIQIVVLHPEVTVNGFEVNSDRIEFGTRLLQICTWHHFALDTAATQALRQNF